MKFIHLSDTHLGYEQYGLIERAEDYFDSFMSAIDKAIDYKVDFIIHTGDFFHTQRPSNETLLKGVEIIKRLNDHNIPIFTIAGNHDRGNGSDKSALEVLSHLGLKVLDAIVDESLGVNIFGIKYISPYFIKRKLKIDEIFENLYEEAPNKNNFNILMLHLEFEPYFSSNISLEQNIQEGMFDYIGIGHYHQRQEPCKIKGATVVYSGSTEYTEFNEKKYVEKGCYLVEVEGKSCKTTFIPLQTRKFLSYSFDDNTLEHILNDIKNLDFPFFHKKPILFLKGKSKEFLTEKDVFYKLEKEGIKDKFLHIKIDITNLSIKNTDFQIIEEIENGVFIKEKLRNFLKEEELEEELVGKLERVIEEMRVLQDPKDIENYLNDKEIENLLRL